MGYLRYLMYLIPRNAEIPDSLCRGVGDFAVLRSEYYGAGHQSLFHLNVDMCEPLWPWSSSHWNGPPIPAPQLVEAA